MESVLVKIRKDLAKLLLEWVRPLKPYYSEGHAYLHIGNTAAHYGEKSARMEGFTRVLWGLGPLFATDNEDLSTEELAEIGEWNSICLDGLIHGTDPFHSEYWGDVYDYDQKMVEMAAIVTALLLAPGKMWKPLSAKQKENVQNWLEQINHCRIHANNWRFFRILVNVFFTVQNLQPDEERLAEDLQVIENCYDGDGWYFDGNPGQMDYYVPFAMHFYGLIYSYFMKEADPGRCASFVERGTLFFKDYVYWFAGNGSSVPFGRSLTYRFAHSAFFAAYAMAGENVDYGVAKGILLGNIRFWTGKPIFDAAGILTIGYEYPNLFMSEKYNAPGSPYWGFKTFLALAMPASHPFWLAEEKKMAYKEQVCLAHPHMLITHNGEHAQMYPVGQHCMEHGACAAKYEKFVYSNQFGFSVPRGTTLESGAFDNTLAVSRAGENFYRMRSGVEAFEVTEEYTRAEYSVGKDVRVESIVIPLGRWHVRIHRIHTKDTIDVADGGYAIGKEECHRLRLVSGKESGKYREDMVRWEQHGVFCDFPWGFSGIRAVADLDGVTATSATLVQAFPNTNILHNLTVIPTLCATLEPGKHTLISCVYGDKERNPLSDEIPKISIVDDKNTYRIRWKGREIIVCT